jgi:predicted flap endonuclease-1-like 5' DNA nuclease
MSLLFRIVYAAHANGTHHKLALDALGHLEHPDAEKWRRLFLKDAELYLAGSKAPDTEFKDFKNHVLHVRDGYWGGAPEKAQSWYGHLVDALAAKDWPQAVYAAGVLSHYVTDPIHPFHTAQTDAENNIHRAVEWSISKSYDGLLAEARAAHPSIGIAMPDGPHWLKDLVCRGAERANGHYERLIAHYDIHRGVTDPPAGLDAIARRVVGELIVYASRCFALILDRAIAQSGATAPDVSLTAETVLLALKIPVKFVEKRLTDASDRAQVVRMYDELMATGRVEEHLPADDRMVRDLFEKEVAAPRRAAQAAGRAKRLPRTGLEREVRPRASAVRPAATAGERSPRETSHRATAPRPPGSETSRQPRPNLSAADSVEAAPSIGPKLAQRLAAGGIGTVADLITADPEAAAMKLGDRRFTGAEIRDWQDQARLMLAVPGLRGGQAQLLVGSGYRSARDLCAAAPDELSAAVLAFAATAEGQRVLRDGTPPDLASIQAWIEQAGMTKAA